MHSYLLPDPTLCVPFIVIYVRPPRKSILVGRPSTTTIPIQAFGQCQGMIQGPAFPVAGAQALKTFTLNLE